MPTNNIMQQLWKNGYFCYKMYQWHFFILVPYYEQNGVKYVYLTLAKPGEVDFNHAGKIPKTRKSGK